MNSNSNNVDWSFYKKNGFTPLVNVSGTMTSIGASIIIDDAQSAMRLISPHFIKIHELQSSAGKIISELTGAESGFITDDCTAGDCDLSRGVNAHYNASSDRGSAPGCFSFSAK